MDPLLEKKLLQSLEATLPEVEFSSLVRDNTLILSWTDGPKEIEVADLLTDAASCARALPQTSPSKEGIIYKATLFSLELERLFSRKARATKSILKAALSGCDCEKERIDFSQLNVSNPEDLFSYPVKNLLELLEEKGTKRLTRAIEYLTILETSGPEEAFATDTHYDQKFCELGHIKGLLYWTDLLDEPVSVPPAQKALVRPTNPLVAPLRLSKKATLNKLSVHKSRACWIIDKA